jgi:hypothetical protein
MDRPVRTQSGPPQRGDAAAHDGVALDTGAALRLWLAPDWTRPQTWLGALARYVAGAPDDGSTCLCLDIGGADATLAKDLVAVACETLAPSGAFAELLIVDGAIDRRDVVCVRGGAEVLAALGVQAPPLPQEAEEIVRRARRGKALADELCAIADHHAMSQGGNPWLDPEPLVTVPIATGEAHERLVARAIPSILEGTYRKVEVLVCSEGPDPAARAAVEPVAARDQRVRYLELPERPRQPSHPLSSWEARGLRAANHALACARGRFVAPLGHDEEFTATHIGDLVGRAREERADLVHAQALSEQPTGPPQLIGRRRLSRGQVCHGTVLYSDRLAHMRYDADCWLLEESGHWNMWRRMQQLGAGVAYLDRVVLLRSAARSPAAGHSGAAAPRRGLARTAADLARDVLGTDAAWYLDVEPAAPEVSG